MSNSEINPKPRSHQERSRRTEQLLLDAALQLFRERGVEAVTVSDIATAAAVAPATIYRRFGDKDGLCREAFKRFVNDSLKMLEIVPAKKPKHDFIQVVADVTALVLVFTRANQRILQSSYAKALVEPYYAEQLVELRRRTLALLKQYFSHFIDLIKHDTPEVAIDFTLRQSMAMITARMEAGQLEVEQGALTDALFIRELLRSILSYLQIPFTIKAIDAALRASGL